MRVSRAQQRVLEPGTSGSSSQAKAQARVHARVPSAARVIGSRSAAHSLKE